MVDVGGEDSQSTLEFKLDGAHDFKGEIFRPNKKPLGDYWMLTESAENRESVQCMQDSLALGDVPELWLDCRGTQLDRDCRAKWSSMWPKEKQKALFGALQANSERPEPCATLFTGVKKFTIFLHAHEGGDDADTKNFDAEALASGLTHFFRGASHLEELEIYWNGGEQGDGDENTLAESVWKPLSENAHVGSTLKRLFVVGGNLEGTMKLNENRGHFPRHARRLLQYNLQSSRLEVEQRPLLLYRLCQ